jgi:quercetin dioxygenase-like cupin family protein
MVRISVSLAVAALAAPCQAQDISRGVMREPVASYAIGGAKTVDRLDVRRFDLSPGAKGPATSFGMPVLGYVASGSITVKLGNGPSQGLTAGDTIFLPAGSTINRLENASATEPAALIAIFLLGKQEAVPLDKVP